MRLRQGVKKSYTVVKPSVISGIIFGMACGMDEMYYNARDAALMRAVAAGDPEAFQEIMDRYLALVSRTSFRILCERKDSEFVTVEVFSRVWNDAADYNPSRPLSEWLLAMTCRICRLRVFRRTVLWILAIRTDIYVTSPPKIPWEDDYISKQAWEIYCRASLKLTSRQRVVYTLCELEGLSVSQVHYITGLRPSVITYALTKARERVKSELKRYGRVR